MDILHMIVLAVVQGVTEFLPISSSAHLIAVSEIFLSGHSVGLDIVLHGATLAAVVLYFKRDLYRIVRAMFLNVSSKEKTMGYALVVATLPVAVVGFFLYEILGSLRTVEVVATALIVSGFLLIVADYGLHRRWFRVDLPLWRKGLGVGLLQILAILPGVSRSGITIAGGRFFGFSRKEASRFSFLLSIPVIAGALLLLLLKTPLDAASFFGVHVGAVVIGMMVAFGVAYAVIHFFLKLIDRIGFLPFFIYQVIAGIALLTVG